MSPLTGLNAHRYINLTTFKKSGEEVSVPVWFAVEGDAIYVWTTRSSGKVKRLRNNSHCEVAPCNASGKRILGPKIKGWAALLEGAEMARCEGLIRKRYGWQYLLIKFFSRRFRGAQDSVVIKIIAA